MPIVKSYYRRSPGAGAALTAAQQPERLTVTVYNGVVGGTPVRWRGKVQIVGLRFGTQIPGGFASCSFTASGAGARRWPIAISDKVIVRSGKHVVWWGWAEDIARRQDAVEVLALGPYEELQQRLISVDYTDEEFGSAIKENLSDNTTYISADHSHILLTGRSTGALARDNWSMAELVEMAVDAGTLDDERMLFALWQPSSGPEAVNSAVEMLSDPSFESGLSVWSYDEPAPGSFPAVAAVDSSVRRSGGKSIKWDWTSAVVELSNNVFQGSIAVSASTQYRMAMWIRCNTTNEATKANATMYIEWYTSGIVPISTDDVSFSAPVADTWTECVAYFTSPANAAIAQFGLRGAIPAAPTSTLLHVDDASMTLAGTTASVDALPRAHLWALDLSDYDYVLRAWQQVEFVLSTRELANYVVAQYGSSYTASAENGPSQISYRRRDALINAGNDATASIAEAVRDTALAARLAPRTEITGSFQARTGDILTAQGLAVDVALVRAGDRLRVDGGEYEGAILLVKQTEWSDGVLTVTPERYAGTAEILARSM
jgi:hypothetical protein